MNENIFAALAEAGFRDSVLPVIPPDAPLVSGSKIEADQLGKVPGKRLPGPPSDRPWAGLTGWRADDWNPSDERLDQWHGWGANTGLKCARFPCLDIDCERADVVGEVLAVVTRYTGGTLPPLRSRGSNRVAVPFKLKDGAEPFGKIRFELAFDDDPDGDGDEGGKPEAVELLSDGQQYVVSGAHPSGTQYIWSDGGLVGVGADGLPCLDASTARAMMREIADSLVVIHGADVKWTGTGERSGTGGGGRMPIGTASMVGDPRMVLDALAAIPCADLSYDDWIQMLAAVKAGLGDDCEDHYEAVESWCLEYGDNSPDGVRSKWDSIHDAAVGADWLFAKAADQGWNWAAWEFDIIRVYPDKYNVRPKIRARVPARIPLDDAQLPDPGIPSHEAWLDELNRYYAIIHTDSGNNVAYLKEDEVTGQPVWHSMTRQKFKDYWDVLRLEVTDPKDQDTAEAVERERVEIERARGFRIGPKEEQARVDLAREAARKFVTPGTAWLDRQEQTTFEAARFDPSCRTISGYYNLWTGFAVEPKEGDWSLFRAHLLDNICSGDAKHFDWLIKWLARGLQCPHLPAETALVMRGAKGAGKGTLAKWYGSIFGSAYWQLIDDHSLLGRFNYHLANKIVIFADESMWGGDKAAVGKLQGMITERSYSIERKFYDQTHVRNMLHLIFATNADWVVPASEEERRYFVLDVSDARKQDTEYFGAIDHEMKNGGVEAMLHDLLRVDLTGWDYRNPPKTEGLARQVIQGMSALQTWIGDRLIYGDLADQSGSDGGADPFDGPDWSEAPIQVSRRSMERLFADQGRRGVTYADRQGPTASKFAQDIVRYLGAESVRRGKTNERWYIIPPLSEAREAFSRASGVPWHVFVGEAD